jgi:hypothetical protein
MESSCIVIYESTPKLRAAAGKTAPKGALTAVATVSLKRYPDTKPEFPAIRGADNNFDASSPGLPTMTVPRLSQH